MRTDKESSIILLILILITVVCILLFVFIFRGLRKCSAAEVAQYQHGDDKTEWYESTIRAYNHLLHRVWIDHPNYVEDVLTECDEFCTLDSLLGGNWADTFEFYDFRDSVEYQLNWYEEPELPPHVNEKLIKVFNQNNNVQH